MQYATLIKNRCHSDISSPHSTFHEVSTRSSFQINPFTSCFWTSTLLFSSNLTPPSFLSTPYLLFYKSPTGELRLKIPRCHLVLGRRSFALLDQDIGSRSNELVPVMEDVLISPRMGKKANDFSWLAITLNCFTSEECLWVSVSFTPMVTALLAVLLIKVFLMKVEVFVLVRDRAQEGQSYSNDLMVLEETTTWKTSHSESSWLSFLLMHSPDRTLYHSQMKQKTR